MGTNYYHHVEICPACKSEHRIHIGKSSSGWTFSFQGVRSHPITGESISSWQDWQAALKLGGVIKDEYGRVERLDVLEAVVRDKAAQKGVLNHSELFPKNNFLDEEGHSFSFNDFS